MDVADRLNKKQNLKEAAHRKGYQNERANKNSEQKLFFHLPFHPKDISRREVQRVYTHMCVDDYTSFKQIYNLEMRSTMCITGITIAYSRPRNLQDCLTPSSLFKTDLINVIQILTK